MFAEADLQGTVMVSKCANPGCMADFRYLHEGKLFHMEFDSAGATSSPQTPIKKSVRRTEFFWLCEECSTRMTVTFQRDKGVTVKPLTRASAAAS
ncbi:MAG: hypothetical protein NVS1B11_26180 [Terriglobales bacterium]